MVPQRGFTYLGLLFGVAIISITLATTGVIWSTQVRRDREADMLWIGDQYRAAIGRYFARNGRFPLALTDLLQDQGSAQVQRYLRKLYPDPMTGLADWQLILLPGTTTIMGVASSSHGQPIKVAGFSDRDIGFDKADCYCEWQFVYTSQYQQRRRAYRTPQQQ